MEDRGEAQENRHNRWSDGCAIYVSSEHVTIEQQTSHHRSISLVMERLQSSPRPLRTIWRQSMVSHMETECE
jgi:hypothetical protein